MVYRLNEEEFICLTLTDESFKTFLKLFEKKLKRNPTFRNGEDLINFALEVAKEFSEENPKIGAIFCGKPTDCRIFFSIFTKSQLTQLRELSQRVSLHLELKPLKEALEEYLKQNFELFKKRLKVNGYSEEEIKEVWNRLYDYFKKLIEEETIYYTRIVSLRIKGENEKEYSSDPLFLTYLVGFELEKSNSQYGDLKESLLAGKIESVEEILKPLVEKKWKAEVDKTLLELGIVDFQTLWSEKRERVTKVIDSLFDAIDSTVRRRLEAEHFGDLIEFALQHIGDNNLKETAQRVRRNLKLLGEIYEENTELGNTLVEAIPVGLEFWDKITDYRVEKDFRYFLYTYKAKINEIATGQVKNHLVKFGKVNPTGVKNRGEYFLKQGELFAEITQNLEKAEKKLLKRLPSYLRGFIKALFYYGNPDKETLKELYENYQKLRVLSLKDRSQSDEIFLKEVGRRVKRLLKDLKKEYWRFEELYTYTVKNILNRFFIEVLPSEPKEIFVAVDFSSLAEIVKDLIEKKGIPPKTILYKNLLRVLPEKRELENFEYIFRVKSAIYNHRLDLDRKITPQVETLKPLKEWQNVFNATGELSAERFSCKKQTFKVAFILSFLLLISLIASRSEGIIIGYSLPHSNRAKEDIQIEHCRDLIYRVIGAAAFGLNSDKIVAVQNFNWKNLEDATFSEDKNPNLYRAIQYRINKKVNNKIKNGLTSLYSNLPFEVQGIELSQKVAVLALSNPKRVERNIKALLGEAYIFEPNEGAFLKVYRKTLIGNYKFIEGDLKSEIGGYRRLLKQFIESLKVEKVLLIPPLPLYKGLSTKEDFLKELYFGDLLGDLGESLGVSLRLAFSSFGIVYTPSWGILRSE